MKKLKNIMTKNKKPLFIPVDSWECKPEDMILKHTKDYIVAPLSDYFQSDNEMINYFSVKSKKAYNSIEIRSKVCHYFNYFEKFYDTGRELLSVYARIKFLIDCENSYTEEMFFSDIYNYILKSNIAIKIHWMNSDNFIEYGNYAGRTAQDPRLVYKPIHIYCMMEISTFIKFLIPLLTHFAEKKKIKNVSDFLMSAYNIVINMYSDIFLLKSKLFESSSSFLEQSSRDNPIIKKQDIRGINEDTYNQKIIEIIILTIFPKYIYAKNPVVLNFVIMKNNIGYQLTEIGYEFDYRPLSSSIRDADYNSEFDKYEASMSKKDESLLVQNKVNCADSMKNIENIFGKVSDEEIEFYNKKLLFGNHFMINEFQKELVFNIFYKYFGDTVSIKNINNIQYIELVVISRKLLQSQGMVYLPWVLSSKVKKLFRRKKLNKSDYLSMIKSDTYKILQQKYVNPKLMEMIEYYAATILSSTFEIIDFTGEFDGKILPLQPEYIIEEVQKYVAKNI